MRKTLGFIGCCVKTRWRKRSKYADEFNSKIYSHWILLGTKNINGMRYSSPWIANEQNGLNIAFGCTDSWKEWVLEEYNWRRYTLSQAADASCWWGRMLGLMDHWSVCSCDLDHAHFVVMGDVDSNLQNNGYWVRQELWQDPKATLPLQSSLLCPCSTVQKSSSLHSNKLTSVRMYVGNPGPLLSIAPTILNSNYPVLVRLQSYRDNSRLRSCCADAIAEVNVVIEFDRRVNYILWSVSAVTARLFTFCPDCCCLTCEITCRIFCLEVTVF